MIQFFVNLDNQTNKLYLHNTVHIIYDTVYYKDWSVVNKKQQEGEYKWKNWFRILTFYVANMVLKISFNPSFCVGFANPDNQTNKLKAAHTLHYTLYTL